MYFWYKIWNFFFFTASIQIRVFYLKKKKIEQLNKFVMILVENIILSGLKVLCHLFLITPISKGFYCCFCFLCIDFSLTKQENVFRILSQSITTFKDKTVWSEIVKCSHPFSLFIYSLIKNFLFLSFTTKFSEFLSSLVTSYRV